MLQPKDLLNDLEKGNRVKEMLKPKNSTDPLSDAVRILTENAESTLQSQLERAAMTNGNPYFNHLYFDSMAFENLSKPKLKLGGIR